MDKEKLIKYHFWILLGLAVLLLPVVMGSVLSGVAGATDKEKKDLESKISALKGSQPKGSDYLTKLDEAKAKLEIDKDRVWKEASQAQFGKTPSDSLIHWPAALSRLDRALNYGAPIDASDINSFKNSSVYEAEYRDMAATVAPTELTKGWKDTLRVIRWTEKNPTPEEVWLALEDMCVQRELLKCVSEVNDLLAGFEERTGPEVVKELDEYFDSLLPKQPKVDDKKETVQRFVSPYWQLDVATSKAGVAGGQFTCRGRLKNVTHRRLNVGRIDFDVWMTDPPEKGGKPVVLPIEADWVFAARAVGEGAEEPQAVFFKRTLSAGAAETKLLAVRQKLTSRYVPVKRIERIELAYHSHRTADQPLQIGLMSDKAKKDAGQAAAPPPTDTAAAGGAAPAASGPPAGDKTPSGVLERQRYFSVSEQVRRMPIGLVMIVDQAHVQDVLRAFANSRLRFQTTQYHLKRLHGNLPPVGGAAGASHDESASNLVEMSLYGLISIYEKYQTKPVEGAPDAAGANKS